ncbi:MAG: ATP/GTP-binding protein [Candidatus Thermoplasmatota archaeon]|nr:ATP/GTP-binding protein [Candidatus Thermoplasmatota archaeon]
MNSTIGIYLVGTAGCGKSTLCASMERWFDENGIPTITMNLDPGALHLPYDPVVDVREWITLTEIMEENGLGPNGAQIVCADLLAIENHRLKEALGGYDVPYVIIDTPGQMELFSFREASKEIVNELFPGHSAMTYLVDPFNSRTPSGLISQMMLSSLSALRFQIPTANVISKSDMIEEGQKRDLERWLENPEFLLDDAIAEASTGQNMNQQLAIEIYKALENLGLFQGMNMVSSKDSSGIDRIYRIIQSIHYGGDDHISPSEDGKEERKDLRD